MKRNNEETLHVYPVVGMEDYLPKKVYYGYAGAIRLFLDEMGSYLHPAADSRYFDETQKRNMLQLSNIARNLALNDLRKDLAIRKMNWYVDKIIKLISHDECSYDGYCIFLEAYIWFDTNKLGIELSDCADRVFGRKCGFDYFNYISEPNYLKRDYSDKLLAYTCNLLELYGKYFEKENDSIGFRIHMNGDKCFGGRGFVEWDSQNGIRRMELIRTHQDLVRFVIYHIYFA